jgi:hypothetical protein
MLPVFWPEVVASSPCTPQNGQRLLRNASSFRESHDSWSLLNCFSTRHSADLFMKTLFEFFLFEFLQGTTP